MPAPPIGAPTTPLYLYPPSSAYERSELAIESVVVVSAVGQTMLEDEDNLLQPSTVVRPSDWICFLAMQQ